MCDRHRVRADRQLVYGATIDKYAQYVAVEYVIDESEQHVIHFGNPVDRYRDDRYKLAELEQESERASHRVKLAKPGELRQDSQPDGG